MIIFDLDQTLIDTIPVKYYEDKNGLNVLNGLNGLNTLNNKSRSFSSNEELLSNIELRPYIKELFDYLNTNNFEYSFWSLGDYEYVKTILTYIEKLFLINPIFILARKDDFFFIDLISKKEIPIFYTNGIMIKKINSLYPYFLYLNPKKLILVDDNINNILNNNNNNVYHISDWYSYNINDIELNNFKHILYFLRLYSNY